MKTFYYKMQAFNIDRSKRKIYVYETNYNTRIQFLSDLNEWSRLSCLTDRTIYTYVEISKHEFLNTKYKG